STLRRDPSPARARTRCSRSPWAGSAVGRPIAAALAPGGEGRRRPRSAGSGLRAFGSGIGQQRRQRREVREGRNTEPLEEGGRGAIENGPPRPLVPPHLLDEAPIGERPEDP